MNDSPAPDDDPDATLEFDPALRERIRAALRDVAPQHPDDAHAARETALSQLTAVPARRQPAWLIVAAAGIVGVLGVAVLGRGLDSPSPSAEKQEGPAVPFQAPPVAEQLAAADAAPPVAARSADEPLDEVIASVRSGEPVETATCPVVSGERSYGVRGWLGRRVEVLVDLDAGTLRLLEVPSCIVVATTNFTP